MLNLEDSEREYLKEIRALTVDKEGREVYAGLTLDESILYQKILNIMLTERNDHEILKTYNELHDKHEKSRMDIIATEVYIRNEKPSAN